MDSMRVGADRIQGLVKSLRSFSHVHESQAELVDIHAGLDSTLMILNSRIKAHPNRPAIEICKDYGNLPPVLCYPGQLNQVFMNLLANAIDALEDGLTGEPPVERSPQIRIQTEITPADQIIIRVADNGPGIPPDIQRQLFQPFFTTKPEGKGSGLGLSISYQVITETHQGTLQCHSTLNEGTEFVVCIPHAVTT